MKNWKKYFENIDEWDDEEFPILDRDGFLKLLTDTIDDMDELKWKFEKDYRMVDPLGGYGDDFENIDVELYSDQLKRVRKFMKEEIKKYNGD